jgi:hypothetical protein
MASWTKCRRADTGNLPVAMISRGMILMKRIELEAIYTKLTGAPQAEVPAHLSHPDLLHNAAW